MFIWSSVLKKIIHQTGIFGNFLFSFQIVCVNIEFVKDHIWKFPWISWNISSYVSWINSLYHRLVIIFVEYLDLTIVYLKSECFVLNTFIYFLYFIALAILFQIPCMPFLCHFWNHYVPRCLKILYAGNPFIKAELVSSRQLLFELSFDKAVAKFCINKCPNFCQDARNVWIIFS